MTDYQCQYKKGSPTVTLDYCNNVCREKPKTPRKMKRQLCYWVVRVKIPRHSVMRVGRL